MLCKALGIKEGIVGGGLYALIISREKLHLASHTVGHHFTTQLHSTSKLSDEWPRRSQSLLDWKSPLINSEHLMVGQFVHPSAYYESLF